MRTVTRVRVGLTDRLGRRGPAAAVAIALLALVFGFLLPRVASYASAWSVVRTTGWLWLAALAVASLADIASGGPLWMVAIPGLGFVRTLRMTLVSTAVSAVAPGGAPAGMATAYAALRSFGVSFRRGAAAMAVVGVWSELAAFAFPGVAAAALALEGGLPPTFRVLAAVGAALFLGAAAGLALVLSRRTWPSWAAGAASRITPRKAAAWARRASGAGAALRDESRQILGRAWAPLTLTTLVNQLTGFLILELSLLAVGLSPDPITLVEGFAAWSVARLLMSLPLTPGGVGVADLGLTGMLVGFGGDRARVIAAVLLFRVFSLLPMLLLGLLAGAAWRLERPGLPR
jgi:uncharacterized membrane protein YbhN (UPF0104 family)